MGKASSPLLSLNVTQDRSENKEPGGCIWLSLLNAFIHRKQKQP